MDFVIKDEIKGRLRIHLPQSKMTICQADTLQYYLSTLDFVKKAKVYERTADAVIVYEGERQPVIDALRAFSYETTDVPEKVFQASGRQLNADYQEKLAQKIIMRYVRKALLPYPIRVAYTGCMALKYVAKGIKTLAAGKIEVPVLDGLAIGVSMVRGNVDTAASVMFLLGIGELLEEWTHKKSVSDLAGSMALSTSNVWVKGPDGDILVPVDQIEAGDQVLVRMGSMIPFDGIVESGEAMVNQASMTGESMPVRKTQDSYVYAGTVVEEGEICFRVKETRGDTRYEKIITMIEETEKLKSASESRAEHLADRLVPYTLAATALTWLLTRNAAKAVAVLMVDFSCALKLAMPVTVLSAIREARDEGITVKGGKYLEAVAEASVIVFDKTGTLTLAKPVVKEIVPFTDQPPEELLRVAACLEEHFPHSMAKAVVDAAKRQGLEHEEMHSKVRYIVAHGIVSEVEGRRVIIGSQHFVFEDEACAVPEGKQDAFDALPAEYSHLYMAVEGELAAVICIEDPLREEAADVVKNLRRAGFDQVVMMTGDSERTASAIAARVGVDQYYSEVLPEDKARFVEEQRRAGRKVVMIGDGINDSPALSAADAGIAISDGAEIAREIADITISGSDLSELVVLKELSNRLMKRIHGNYRTIVGFNTTLIAGGVAGVLQPTTTAWLHNGSTIAITLRSMKNLLPQQA